MPSLTKKRFGIFAFRVVPIEPLTGRTETLKSAHYMAKPAIVLSLIFLVLKTAESLSKSIQRLILLALFFSLAGDVLLLFEHESEHVFTSRLVALLTAHLT